MMIRHFNTTNVYALFCFGHEKRLALTGLADGVATLALSAALVSAFGLAGAPLGAIAGVVLVSAPLNLGALSRETSVAAVADREHPGAVALAIRDRRGDRRGRGRLDSTVVVSVARRARRLRGRCCIRSRSSRRCCDLPPASTCAR